MALKLEKTDYPSVFLREDGKYIAAIDYGYVDALDKKTGKMVHKQKRTRKVCDTLREAKKLVSENNVVKADNKNRNKVDALNIRFTEAHAKYIHEYEKDWSESYLYSKRTQGKHMCNYLGKMKVKNITTIDIERYYRYMRDELGLSETTIKHHQSQLRDEFKYFLKQELVKYNPAKDAKRPTLADDEEEFEDKVLTLDIVKRMFTYALTETDKSILILLTLTTLCGMRKGEVAGLKYKDLIPEEQTIYIHNNRVQRPEGGGYFEKLPKSNKARYTDYPEIAQYFIGLAKKQQEMLLGRPVNGEDYVYVTPYCIVNHDKHPLPSIAKVSERWRQFFRRWMKYERNNAFAEIRKKEGIARTTQVKAAVRDELLVKYNYTPVDYLRLHGLRHTFISILIDNGLNYITVANCAGHKISDLITLSRYYHPRKTPVEINQFWDKELLFFKNDVDEVEKVV